MRTIIAGSRSLDKPEPIKRYLDSVRAMLRASNVEIAEVVCGCARGVDTIGEQWANENGIPVARFPADWDRNGRQAGPIRNLQMAKYADALIAIWDGKSRGTKNMLDLARRHKLFVWEISMDIPKTPPSQDSP